MKRKFLAGGVIALALTGGVLIAADHIDAPAVKGASSESLGTDITDVYAFQSPSNNSNLVLVCNVMGLLSPTATAAAGFPSNTMYEFNIDNNGDNVEDLVIQAMVRNNKIVVFGPVAPGTPGSTSTVRTAGPRTDGDVTTYGQTAMVSTNVNGTKIFAGPRDDPFFFDLARFQAILGGTAPGFRSPGIDAFAGTNVMSIVVEVPKALLGSSPNISVWAESKVK